MIATTKPCPFCHLELQRIVAQNELAVAYRDGFPVAEGHTLIIPRRHAGSFFDLTPEEREAMFDFLDQTKRELDSRLHPDGYNVGINDGPAAGQTVPHVHIHLIPRFTGDVPDPRGGVRWIIPTKADYWSEK